MKSLLIIFCLFTHLSFGQVRHSIVLEYPGTYFWGSGDPLGFQDLKLGSFELPSLSYGLTVKSWGLMASYVNYVNGYNYRRPTQLETSNTGRIRAYTLYAAASLNAMHSIWRSKKLQVHGLAGPFLQFNGETMDYEVDYFYQETYLYRVENYRRFGLNAGFLAQYIFWKGFSFQTSLTQTRLFKANTHHNMTQLKLGLGYTFGGGMNRSQKRKSVP